MLRYRIENRWIQMIHFLLSVDSPIPTYGLSHHGRHPAGLNTWGSFIVSVAMTLLQADPPGHNRPYGRLWL